MSDVLGTDDLYFDFWQRIKFYFSVFESVASRVD